MTEQTQFDKTVGRMMRLRRIEQGLTQKKLAEKLSVSFQQVQKYEAGVNRLSAERLWQLSEVFGVPMQYWVAGEGAVAEQVAAHSSITTDRRAIHLMQYFSRIGDEEIKGLLFAFTRILANRGSEGKD